MNACLTWVILMLTFEIICITVPLYCTLVPDLQIYGLKKQLFLTILCQYTSLTYMLSISLRVMLETVTPAWIRKNHLNHGLKENMLWSVSYVVITHSMWLRSICILIDYRIYSWILAGFGFSRPKPVFPVQNGIIWDKHIFLVPNWEKLSKTGKKYAALYFKL